jgi:hypothetical protein
MAGGGPDFLSGNISPLGSWEDTCPSPRFPPRGVRRTPSLPEGEIKFPPREIRGTPALPEGEIICPPMEVWSLNLEMDFPSVKSGGFLDFDKCFVCCSKKPISRTRFGRNSEGSSVVSRSWNVISEVLFDSCIFVCVSRVPGAVDALNHVSRCEAMADSESEHPLPERDPMTSPTPRPPKNRRCKGRCQSSWHVTPEGRGRPQCCFQQGHSKAWNTFRKHHCMWGPRMGP